MRKAIAGAGELDSDKGFLEWLRLHGLKPEDIKEVRFNRWMIVATELVRDHTGKPRLSETVANELETRKRTKKVIKPFEHAP